MYFRKCKLYESGITYAAGYEQLTGQRFNGHGWGVRVVPVLQAWDLGEGNKGQEKVMTLQSGRGSAAFKAYWREQTPLGA